MLMSLPYISGAGSLTPMALPRDFDIFWTPSRPSRMGVMRMIWGFWPKCFWRSRPRMRLNFWSVPPSSTSHSRATES